VDGVDMDMRVLASRSLLNHKMRDAAKVAALAAPMVLVECGGSGRNGAHAPAQPIVVVEVPAAPAQPKGGENPEHEKREKPAREAHKATVLNASIIPGCAIEARLSVIRPDNTLEKVVLDPKADFFYTGADASMFPGSMVLMCSETPECDVSNFITGKMQSALIRNYPNEVVLDFLVIFHSEPDSGLSPSQTMIRVTQDEIFSYCH
jgi:hypothetical protein